ncbi:cytidine deaminase [Aureispira anguillae]|uniref:Cytidine deaminase n=1 Tax=Aureispira anguillae TaxID=2864201 RepID=A0A915VKK4_9BACT|nr:cytidine deaminase [Aureispira anguillae]BDS09733.1 cytidine deaminase [Aureispira anguillae]
MKKITLQSTIEVANQLSELNAIDADLLKRAKEAAKGAYAPYSNFKVGAAVLMNNGAIVIGSNQENAAFPVTMCGERNAIFSAAAQYPNTPIIAVAITIISAEGQIDRPVPPCGSCRQVIYENEVRHQTDIRIILQGDLGDIYVIQSVKDVLPLLFDASYL